MPDVISDTAQAVVDDAGAGSDPAARAAALAAWFHGNGFVYNEQVPGSFDGAAGSAPPVQVVASFLSERTGYCVHYSAAFTLMARSLGLPTRIAVGYASTSTAASAGDWVRAFAGRVPGDALFTRTSEHPLWRSPKYTG